MSQTPDLGKGPEDGPPRPHPYQPYQPYVPQPSPYGGYGGYGPTGVPWGPPPDHPQATTSLVLGILGLVLCQVLSPFAWVTGGRTVREIDASGGRLGGRSNANAGRICGIVGTVILGCYLAVLVLVVIVALASPESFDDAADTGSGAGSHGLAPAAVPVR